MLAVLFALTASLAYGLSDFLGGLKSRSSPVLSVLLVSQAAGLVLLLLVVLSRGDAPPGGPVLAVAASAGLGEAIAVAALYRGLAIGRMGIVAALSALAPVLPVVAASLAGEPPTPLQLLGMVVAIAGVVGIARGHERTQRSSPVVAGVVYGLLAAGGFGVFYVGIDAASDGSVPWALAAARTSAVALLLLAAAIHRPRKRVRAREVPALVAIGALIVGADSLYAFAAARGNLGMVAVLASLYPVVTMALARRYLREQLSVSQQLGVGLCLAGVLTIAVT